MRKIRGGDIAMIFQEPMTSLNPVFTVGDQISEALILHQDMTEDQAMKVAECFSGGVRKGEVCGAVSGAIMVIGLKYGDGPDYKATAYPKAAEFMDRFKEKNASYVCRDILGCDISSEEGMLYARENDLFKDICPRMVESVVDILEEMEI